MKEMLHIINAFETASRGSERAALEAARLLQDTQPVTLWSTVRPAQAVQALALDWGVTIQTIQPFAGRFPKGGVLLIWGTHFDPGMWLSASHCTRVVVVNELFNYGHLYRVVLQVKAAGLPTPLIVHVSTLLRDASALDGPVLYPTARLHGMFGVERVNNREPLVVGRVSRDVPEKHHVDDPLLYRTLIAEGLAVRLQGARVLADALRDRPEITLLPENAHSVESFLGSIDIFFYRTAGEGVFVEPSGLVVAEAMAAGLPVVAVRPGGFADLFIDGENGFLVDSQEQAYLAIMRLARDPALRRSIGATARKDAQRRFGAAYAERLRELVCGPLQ
jgi:glycosyltransferase involved in cell wall biosynthesis